MSDDIEDPATDEYQRNALYLLTSTETELVKESEIAGLSKTMVLDPSQLRMVAEA